MISIHIFKDQRNVWAEATKYFIQLLNNHARGKILIFLSGGSSINLYKKIKYQISPRQNLAFAQVDERFQPSNNQMTNNKEHKTYNIKQITENINGRAIEKTGLWEVCRRSGISYYTISQKGTLEEAANKYNQTISKLFKIYTYKIAILGIGEDGHTAGLLPGYEKIWHIASFAVGYENDGCYPKRISLTPNSLQKLDYVLVVTTGRKKKEALKRVLDLKYKNKLDKYPAAILQRIKRVDLFTDVIIGSS